MSKSTFNIDWTDPNLNPQWAAWIESVRNNPYVARCRFCEKSFSLSNMGRQAISSHEESVKHKKKVPIINQPTIPSIFSEEKKVEQNINIASSSSISPFLSKKEVTRAEIIWAMKLIMSHSSCNSFKDSAEIFRYMFPDSEIGKKISLSSSKMAYVIVFGIAPYFHKRLLNEISKNRFVLCIDEALNKISQKGQMDIIIRYWPEESKEIKVRYLTSLFLGHSTAVDLYENFCEGTAELDLSNLLQISLDGPSVNLKFLHFLQEELKESNNHSLLNIGTCSLHAVHGAFQRGNKKSGWKLNETFSAMYRLFKDSPARQSDFITLTNTTLFPLKFCQIRWVENVSGAERAIEVFPNVKKYFENSKKKLPNSMTCTNLDDTCSDKLILAKMSFFCSIANILHPFLTQFQSPKPMVPFMYDSFSELIRTVMSKFIKKEILKNAKTMYELFKTNYVRTVVDVALPKS